MATTSTVRAGIYARLSKALDLYNVEGQIADGRKVAERIGAEVVETFTDNNKGASRQAIQRGVKRDAWLKVLDVINAREIDVLIVYNLDRLLRTVKELEVLIDAVEAGQLIIHQLSAGEIDLSDADQRMQARIKVSFAEHETDRNAERQQRMNGKRRADGRWTNPGRRQYGYGDGGVIIPDEAAVVVQMAQKAVDGVAAPSIARWLNGQGIPTTEGGKWSSTGVMRLLTAPRVAGWIGHGSHRDYITEGEWVGILTREIQDEIRAAFTGRSLGKAGRRSMMTGLIRCAHCGRSMSRSYNNQHRPIYRCVKRSDTGEGCGQSIVADPVDRQVRDVTLHWLSVLDGRERSTATVDEPREDLDVLEREKAGVWTAYNDGMISFDQWNDKTRKLQERIGRVQAAQGQRVTRGRIRDKAGDLTTVGERWDVLGEDVQRGLISMVVDHVVVTRAARRGAPNVYDRFEVEPVAALRDVGLTVA